MVTKIILFGILLLLGCINLGPQTSMDKNQGSYQNYSDQSGRDGNIDLGNTSMNTNSTKTDKNEGSYQNYSNQSSGTDASMNLEMPINTKFYSCSEMNSSYQIEVDDNLYIRSMYYVTSDGSEFYIDTVKKLLYIKSDLQCFSVEHSINELDLQVSQEELKNCVEVKEIKRLKFYFKRGNSIK
jgi:hypothetical protein